MSKSNQAWQDERDALSDGLSNQELHAAAFNDHSFDPRVSLNPYYQKMQKEPENASHEATFDVSEQLARAIAWEVNQRMHFVMDMHYDYPPMAEVRDIAKAWIEYFRQNGML